MPVIRRSPSLAAATVLLLVVAFAAGSAAAQGAASAAAPEASAAPMAEAQAGTAPGLWSRTLAYVRDQQRRLHRELASAIRTLRDEGSATAAWSLIVLSLLYGVFHAAGPGHGKAIISTYLLTHESAVRRGLALSAAAAFTQGLTAIALVEVLVTLVGWTRRDTQAAAGTMESVSFALIALLGLALAARALWALGRRLRPVRLAAGPLPAAAGGGPIPPHDHAMDRHASGHHGPGHHVSGHQGPGHHEGGDHGAGRHGPGRHGALHGPGCGHSHGPDPDQLARPLSFKSAAAIVLSIGIRPCSGSILVLLFAEVLGLRWAGIAAVLAISLGTAATVGALAVLAVNFRRLASALAGGSAGRLATAAHAVALLGGLLIAWLGASLFLGSLGGGHPLL